MNIIWLLKRMRARVYAHVRKLRDAPAEHYLSSLKASQKDSFLSLQANFLPIYRHVRNLETQGISKFVTPLWQDYNEELKKVFLPQPPFDFLRNKIIRNTMFVDARGEWLTKEVAFLEKMLSSKRLRELLEEDYVWAT